MAAVAAAPLPPPPVMATVGAPVYPVPALVIVMERITLVTVGKAEAFDPPPPVKCTVGAKVYPDPLFVIVTPVTLPPETVAVAVAPLPLPPVNETVGAEV